MNPLRRTPLWPVLLVALTVLAGACASNAPQDTLEPEGPIARDIDNLVTPVFLIAAVVFVLVEVGVLVLVWRFRNRDDHDDDEVPQQVHGNIPLELGWTILPALILTVVAVLTVNTIFDISSRPGDDAWEGNVTVVGKQWWWEYRYDLDNDGEVDFRTANDLVIPAGQEVELAVTSEDVIHSFWIPKLNGKMDAVPGRHHPLVLESDGPGTFVGQCTEFCGLSHGYMRQRVVAVNQADFDTWASNQLEPAEVPGEGTPAGEGANLFTSVCSSCHLVRGVNDQEFAEAGEGVGPTGLVAGPGPDLTHLMTRGTFAGAVFDLWEPSDGEVTPSWSDIGGTLNTEDLAAWLRNPAAQKPMAPELEGRGRGMPDFNLSEEQIDQLIAFFETLD